MISNFSIYPLCGESVKVFVYRILEQGLETGSSLSLYEPIMRERIALHGFLALGLVLSACAKDENPAAFTGEEIRFSAYKNRIVTRSGKGWSPFETGTKYDLYVIDYAATPDWTPGNALLYAETGTEQSDGTIDYGPPVQFPENALNFYAVTDGTPVKPTPVSPATLPPAYEIALDGEGKLTDDLMWAAVTGRNANSGNRVELDFTHTLSKIKFEIAKQSDEAPMNDIYIQSILLENMYDAGTLNLQTGTYTLGTPTATRPYYERGSATKQYIATNQTGIKTADGTALLETLIFPRSTDNPNVINVKVVLGKDGESDGWRTVDVPVEYVVDAETDPDATAPFEFRPNYEYVLTLMVTDNTVRLLVFETQVYEWIDVDYDEEETQGFIGKPVSFGGIMWMDRNLGAQSSDCYNDWDNCRGYYYQFGRNIPYILEKGKTGSNLNHFYTYDQNGNRVQTSVIDSSGLNDTQVAFNPGDIPENPKAGYTGYEFYQAGNVRHWLSPSLTTKPAIYWRDIKNHPCPDGWRLPSAQDYASFLPDPSFSGTVENLTTTQIGSINSIGSGVEDRIIGKLNGVFSVYMIKRKGTNNSYRIRIRRLNSAQGATKQYFEISRYAGSNTDDFTGMTVNNVEEYFDWNHPSEILTIPAVGFIISYSNKLNGDGILTVLRTNTTTNNSTTGILSTVCYLRTDGGTFGLSTGHNHSMGDNIRCVRDI